jgi:hypothetical protein
MVIHLLNEFHFLNEMDRPQRLKKKSLQNSYFSITYLFFQKTKQDISRVTSDGVFLTPQIQSRTHPCQGYNFTHHLKLMVLPGRSHTHPSAKSHVRVIR